MSVEDTLSYIEDNDVFSPIILAEFDFDPSPVLVFSGLGELVWQGKTFTGLGNLGEISNPQDGNDLRANTQAYRLNGIPSEYLGAVLTENYQGRRSRLWLGVLDEDGQLAGDPYLISDGRMDTATIEDNGDTGSITIQAETILIDLDRPRERRYTHEDQQDLHPGDKFFVKVTASQNKEIIWK